MGLFDEIVCEYPLPDGWVPHAGVVFQTKDTDDQYLTRFTLGADGKLRRKNGEVYEHHGALRFYTSNWSGSGPWGLMTDDDQPYWSAEYIALYDHGQLLKIEGCRTDPDTSVTWITRAEWHAKSAEADAARTAPASADREGGE